MIRTSVTCSPDGGLTVTVESDEWAYPDLLDDLVSRVKRLFHEVQAELPGEDEQPTP